MGPWADRGQDGDGHPKGWLFWLSLQNLRLLWGQMRVLVALFVMGYAVSVLVLLTVAGRFSYESLDVFERLGHDPRATYTVAFQQRTGAETPGFDWQGMVQNLLTRDDLQALQLVPHDGMMEPDYRGGEVALAGRYFSEVSPWPVTLDEGRPFGGAEMAAGEQVALLGAAAAHRLGVEPEAGETFTLLGTEWQVVGIYGRGEGAAAQHALHVPVTALLPLLAAEAMPRVSMTAYLWQPLADTALAAFEEQVAVSAGGHLWEVADRGAIFEENQEGALRANVAALIITAAVALLAAANVAALLRYWIKRRRHEVSVRLASGASCRDVRAMLFFEQLVLLAAAMVLGGAVFAGLVPLLAADGIGMRTEVWNTAAIIGALAILLYGVNWLIGREISDTSLVTELRGANL